MDIDKWSTLPNYILEEIFSYLSISDRYRAGLYDARAESKIRSLSFEFPCYIPIADDPNGIKLFGIGGQLIASLKKLHSKLMHLKYLKLTDLVLERFDANHLLDEISQVCSRSLLHLELINVTTVHCPITQIGMLTNLQILIISPQSMNDNLLVEISMSSLKDLKILQNDYTPESILPCSAMAWHKFRCNNSNRMRIHLCVESTDAREILLQQGAPIYSIWYKTEKTEMRSDVLRDIISMYKNTLEVFGYENLPKFDSPRLRSLRMDRMLIDLLTECRALKIIVIREKISTSTVLLLANIGSQLRHFVVRKNAVLLKCDWSAEECKSNGWNYQWLRRIAKSYEKTEAEVSTIFNRRWTMHSDRFYKQMTFNRIF